MDKLCALQLSRLTEYFACSPGFVADLKAGGSVKAASLELRPGPLNALCDKNGLPWRCVAQRSDPAPYADTPPATQRSQPHAATHPQEGASGLLLS